MKSTLNQQILHKATALILIASFIFNISYAQKEQQEAGKKPVMVQLSFYKNAEQSRTVVAVASAKNDSGKLVFVVGIKVNFYVLQPTGASFLANAFTDEGGKAIVLLPKIIQTDTSGLKVAARIENDNVYENAEEEGMVKDARLALSLAEEDTSRIITATVTEKQLSGEEKPVANVEVIFGIQRLFGIMPFSDEATVTTDDNGMASFNFPKKIEGDESGNIVLVARITDNEVYGNVEATAKSKWGVPLAVEKNPFPRALWEPKAPILLMVVFSIIFGGIWFTYSIVIYQITKIEKKASA